MKYKDKYPNMVPITEEQNLIIKGRTEAPCIICGEPTAYIEICSEARFCSEECEQEFYAGFMEALTNSPDYKEFEFEEENEKGSQATGALPLTSLL